MRNAAYGLIVLAGIGLVGWTMVANPTCWGQTPEGGQPNPVLAARLPVAAAGQMMAFSAETAAGPAQVILIDTKAESMCVYHVDRATGTIQLKSVRKFHWDFLIEDFNGTSPLPREIQAILEQR